MKIRHLTQKQMSKVDKIDTLLTQLREEGVYPYIEMTCGGGGLTFIRSNNENRTEIGDVLISPSENYKLYREIKDKEYEAPDTYRNSIDVLGM